MELIKECLTISFFCVGLRIVSGKGMILYFIRKPYERLDRFKKIMSKRSQLLYKIYWNKAGVILSIRKVQRMNIFYWILKALVGCVTCMGGIWTLVIDPLYFQKLDKWTFLTIFIVCCMNTIIYNINERLIK